nr:hypothetical protein [Aromatoleum evansii]
MHASDFIAWVDASGVQGGARRPVPAQNLRIRLDNPPSDLELVHKTAGTILWRKVPAELRRVIDGAASPADLAVPMEADEPLYAVAGEVLDPAGHFLPRRFALSAGRRAEHALRLFRSPLGTRFGRAGGLTGRTTLEDGSPVPWALLALRVTPPLATPFDFVAQSDAHGEFRLSLERLPALTKDAPATTYPGVLTVRAAASGTDPDALPAARVRGTGSGNAAFKTQITVDIAPGRIATLASPGRDALVLQFS